MIQPLHFSFVVNCSADHAFDVWAKKTSMWWPPTHTVSGEAGVDVIFEPWEGGRIFERDPGGEEVEWGTVTVWKPPQQLSYLWRIRTDEASATDVDIQFMQQADGSTRVEIQHVGWERLGERGPAWRKANLGGWNGVLPDYRMACERNHT